MRSIKEDYKNSKVYNLYFQSQSMKKITKSILKNLPYTKLYLEDLEWIFDLLKEEGFKQIQIKTNEYELTPEELTKIKENELSSITIRAFNPFLIIIELGSSLGHDAKIYTSEDTTKAIGIVEKIRKLFKKRRRLVLTYITKPWFALIVALVMQSIALLILKFDGNKLLYTILFASSLIFIGFAFFLDTGYIFPKNLIILDYNKDRPNFWIRNKDRIIIMILTIIFTAMITIFITSKFIN